MDQFLMARRLVEAGVRCVTLSFGSWDRHGGLRTVAGSAGSARPGDYRPGGGLAYRDLDQDVSVIAWGEFGRTPRINASGGRDHWPQVSSALLAGGGMKMGQVIGSTNRLGEVRDRPVHFQEVFAPLYHQLGIDVGNTTIADPSGRPQFLVDRRDVIRELV